MQDVMDKLLKLQEIDLRFKRLQERMEKIPENIEQKSTEVESIEEKLEEKKQEKTNIQKKIDRKNLNIEDIQDKQEDLKKKLHKAESNKEYSALQNKIGRMDADAERIEEEMLELMEKQDEKEEEIEELEEQLEQTRNNFQAFKSKQEQKLDELEEKCDELREEREELCNEIPSEPLDEYESIHRAKKDSRSLAPVNDGVCQGCFLNLREQELNELYRKEELIFCRNCSRILIFPDDS